MSNQASEDELVRKAILKILHQTESCTGCKDHYKKPHKCDMDLAAPRCVKRVRKLEALLRTEKLKLLAEVREQIKAGGYEASYEISVGHCSVDWSYGCRLYTTQSPLITTGTHNGKDS